MHSQPLMIIYYILANCIHVHILQTVIFVNCHICTLQNMPCFLANCHLANCHTCILQNVMFPYKLHHNLLQTIISFQRWVVEYGLIARGAAMDLKSITSIRAHLDKLSLDDNS